jgi:hypothetical protein
MSKHIALLRSAKMALARRYKYFAPLEQSNMHMNGAN